MSLTLQQIFVLNPSASVADTDLFYLVKSPYTPGTDSAILGSDLKTAFGTGTVTSISAGTGITLTPNPITTTGSVALTIPVVVSSGGTGLTAVTIHNLLIGNGTTALTLLAPSATSGIPLISRGAALDPAYGTAVVAGGGTGSTSFTAFSVICSGITGTGLFQNVSASGNVIGNILTSNGIGAYPTWQAPAASGIVSPGLINQMAWYAATGSTVSGLTIVNSAGLLTNSSGVPGWVASTGTGAPVLGTAPTISTPQINQINGQVNNKPVVTFADTALAVNSLNIVSANTGDPVNLQFTGSDTNVSTNFVNKGSGSFTFLNNLTGSLDFILTLSGATTAVNYLVIASALTTAAPTISAAGTDSNVAISLVSKGTGGIILQGTSTNDSASAGKVGEFLSASNLAASPIVFTTATPKSLQSITLTAGDWDVWGNIFCSGTTVTSGQVGLSTTNNTQPDNSLTQYIAPLATGAALGPVAPQLRFSTASNLTVYIVGSFTGTGTLNCSGGIYARRVR